MRTCSIRQVSLTTPNVGESPQFGTMIKGSKAQRVLADKAYASRANRAALKGKHRDGILHKAVRGRPLRQ
jgi:transposase, IS5 family